MTKMKRLTVYLSAEMYRAVKVACASDGVAVTSVLRELLEHKYGTPPAAKRLRPRKATAMHPAE